jgi:adenosylcobinamide-phosphate synthase
MFFVQILLSACLLDILFGDPRWFPHPVRGIGWLASRMEQFTCRLPVSERNSGRLTVCSVLLFTCGSCAAFFYLLAQLTPPVLAVGTTFALYTTIAARDLISHAVQVYDALGIDLTAARQKVAMIVGRDTEQLDEAGVVRACVESVAENMADGIIAPLFWAVIGATAAGAGGLPPAACGATAAMLYKAVSTMDSMFGYKNEQYLNFGRCAALLDDGVNFLPARLSGLAIVTASPLSGGSWQHAWCILLRDRRQHSSPNSGWPEAAAAGALGLQLGGAASYFGKISSKPTLGEPFSAPSRQHIIQACRLVGVASFICLLLFCAILLFLFPAA